jgi:predicted RNase H-like HicB family nuclease
MSYQLNIVIEEDENGFYAYCPELAECQSQGNTLEEIKNNIYEEVEHCIEALSNLEKERLLEKKVTTMTLDVLVA